MLLATSCVEGEGVSAIGDGIANEGKPVKDKRRLRFLAAAVADRKYCER